MLSSLTKRTSVLLVAVLVATFVSAAHAEESTPKVVGVDERLGEKIPIEDLTFNDEEGKPIKLAQFFDRPVVLTLVYFRCPGICTPLLKELARVVQLSTMTAGKDYRMITIGFDPNEGPDLAKLKRENMLKSMHKKPIPPETWRFFTGDAANIRKLTEAVGFNYTKDENGQDYIHAATLMFIGKGGLICRYLEGTQFNPADFEMAVIDASEGRYRSFMRHIQKLCYSYEPTSHSYVLKVNRIILGATLLFVVLFIAFLLFIKPKKPRGGTTAPKDDTKG